jgi:hypothetical protein
MVAWAETMVRGPHPARSAPQGASAPERASAAATPPLAPHGAASSPGGLRVGVDPDGNVVAGMASFDATRALFASEEAAVGLLQGGEWVVQAVGGSAPQREADKKGGTPGKVVVEVTTRLKNLN